jgi:hypothetical protein
VFVNYFRRDFLQKYILTWFVLQRHLCGVFELPLPSGLPRNSQKLTKKRKRKQQREKEKGTRRRNEGKKGGGRRYIRTCSECHQAGFELLTGKDRQDASPHSVFFFACVAKEDQLN